MSYRLRVMKPNKTETTNEVVGSNYLQCLSDAIDLADDGDVCIVHEVLHNSLGELETVGFLERFIVTKAKVA